MKKETVTKNSALAITGFVLSLIFFIPAIPFIGAIIGVIALIKLKNNTHLKGKGFAIAAIIVGVIITIIQIVIIIMVLNTVGNITGVIGKSPQESVAFCLEQNPSPQRDVCILLAVASNINATDQINKNTCMNIQTLDIQHLCNAMLTKDRKYCDQIQDAKTQADCYEIIIEIQNKGY